MPSRIASAVRSALAQTSSLLDDATSVATAAAAHSGLALKVPWWPIFSRPAALAAAAIELGHDVGAAGDRAAGQAAGDDLGEDAQVGRDAVARLRAAARPAKARDHLVEDQQHAVRARELAQLGEEARRQRHLAPGGAGRLQDDRRDVVARLPASRRRGAGSSAGSRIVCSTRPAGMPAGTPPSKCDMAPGRHAVVPAVEVADEADHLRLGR